MPRGGKKLCNWVIDLFKVDSAAVVIGAWKLMCGKVYSSSSPDRVILESVCAICVSHEPWCFTLLFLYCRIHTGCPGGNVPYVKVHRSNLKHLYPKLNGYGDNGERKVWSSCGSTYCTCFAFCYPYTAHVRPSVSQPSQAHSAFIINKCHSYSEL